MLKVSFSINRKREIISIKQDRTMSIATPDKSGKLKLSWRELDKSHQHQSNQLDWLLQLQYTISKMMCWIVLNAYK